MLDGEYPTRLLPPWFLVDWKFPACYLDLSFSNSEDTHQGILLRVLVLIQQVRAGTGNSTFPNMLSGGFDALGAQTTLGASRPTPCKTVAISPMWLLGHWNCVIHRDSKYKVHLINNFRL